MQHYDVAIIGGGIGGLMSAYELATKAPGAKVVLFEKGHDIEKRACPIVTEKAPTCILPNRFWITSSRQTVFCSTSARLQSASCPTTS